MNAETPPPVMTVREVATYLNVHPSTIYRLLKAKVLPGWKIGSEIRFTRDQIDAWMAAQPRADSK